MALFVGRLSTNVRTKDLEELFSRYGKLKRCDLKGRFAFVTFEDELDAEDAVKELHGKELEGSRINVEWSRESGRRSENPSGSSSGSRRRRDGCFNCGKPGHIARDCRSSPRRRDSRRDSYRRSRSPRDRSSRSSRDRSRDRSPRKRDDRSPRDRSSRSPRRSPRDRSRDRSPRKRDDRSPRDRNSHSPRRSPRDKSPERKDRKSPSPKRDNNGAQDSPQKD